MMQNLSQMTNAELKRFLSQNRNNEEAFRAALGVLMDRRDPTTQQPYPFDLENPQIQVEALLREKLGQSENQA
ncbi:MAG: hypothetical protein HC899_17510 [Leptolyngbyaceae cyanobacterium SM1_4_3]|nr:hypothetical protein [Leptolyngbyaceae cyanobacterium SM1_4_3]NJN90044.1 hypothetical protein [Leptolyngbyaceae cyanobacterium SL_5_14]NJO66245.1 hypothetical protein [Leptolyngbyaceae cyanobacterium RM1_405_57]